jgi:hypothetical protein
MTMPEDNDKPNQIKAQKRLSEHPDLAELIGKEYMAGGVTYYELSIKHGVSVQSIQHRSSKMNWREKMEEDGIPIPREPQANFTTKSDELIQQVEKAFMENMPVAEIARKYSVSRAWIEIKAKKHNWKFYRKELIAARSNKIGMDSIQSKLDMFDEMSCKFVDMAIVKLQELIDTMQESGIDPEQFEKLVKMHGMLLEKIKKIPINQTPTASGNGKTWVHPALRPAPWS